jgi:uncharacterized protein
MNEFDNPIVNQRFDPTQAITEQSQRRLFLKSSAAVVALFSSNLGFAQTAKSAWGAAKPFTFESVPLSMSTDGIVVPKGYRWAVLAAWGDPINGKFPVISYDVINTPEQQAKQFGMHHDGCAFFPDQGSSSKGLWVVNHEYTDDGLLHPDGMKNWSAEKVRKSQAAHGVTVAHIQKNETGGWQVVAGPYSRRVTGYTPCAISGPAAGTKYLQTAADPKGRIVLGTINNCANGVTPWGTYLTCEENINGYFVKKGKVSKEEQRIGINAKGFGYRWEEFDERFNVDLNPNEPNRFGWVVEIDPRNPDQAPIKRTALGRFKHEGAEVTLAKDGRVVVYMGDDQRGEYVYRYVSKNAYQPNQPERNRTLLDEGTLFVAKFADNGEGRWIPLVLGQNGLTPENGFPDQAYILVEARLAADQVKATPLDRPEWVAVHPQSKDVYVALTNNNQRGKEFALNAANPRANNQMGHIIRWKPRQQDAASERFDWEIFVLAGDPENTDPNLKGNLRGDVFGSPDGLWFDQRGILWTQTDISSSTLGKGAYARIPNNMMFAADPVTREFRRFLIGPNGCEVTGVDLTPDYKTMFVNIQHPGESPSERSNPDKPKAFSDWPDRKLFSRPRSATIVIWREDGKPVGA